MPLKRNEVGLLVAIVAVLCLTTVLDSQHTYLYSPRAATENIVRSTVLMGIFALGSAIVIIAGGIDLSTGSVIAFSSTVCASVLYWLAPAELGQPKAPLGVGVIALAIAITIGVGFLIGTLHAWLITVLGLPPFIATLASLVGLRSFAKVLIEQVTSGSTQIIIANESFRRLGTDLKIPIILFCILAVAAWILMARTVVGRHLYALGGNEQAARLSGIRTDRLKWLAYCLSAIMSSIAGILYLAYLSMATPESQAVGYELNAIAAAVVGGCSLQGGLGTIPGVVLGMLFLQTVIDGTNKTIKAGANKWEGLVVGILVVLAVAVNELRRFAPRVATTGPRWKAWLMSVGGTNDRLFPGVLGWLSAAILILIASTLVHLVSRQGAVVAGVLIACFAALKIVSFSLRDPSQA